MALIAPRRMPSQAARGVGWTGAISLYTLLDLRNPRRLVPVDPSVAHAMANSNVRLSGGGHGYVASMDWL
jgi:hypothetical protein